MGEVVLWGVLGYGGSCVMGVLGYRGSCVMGGVVLWGC